VAGKAAGLLTFKVEDAAEQLTAEHLEQDPSQQPDVLRVCGAQAVELLAGLVRVLVTAAAECSATKSVRAAQIKVGWGVGVRVVQMLTS
jgi:hypothetical protein